MRTTLRHPDFCLGWKNIIALKLTDEEEIYDTNGMSIGLFFKTHFYKNNFGKWLSEMIALKLNDVKKRIDELTQLYNPETITGIKDSEETTENNEEFLPSDDQREPNKINSANTKSYSAIPISKTLQDANLVLNQLFFLGIDDNENPYQ